MIMLLKIDIDLFFHRLSERNCIEILIKLQQMKLLDVIHTIDGKEYLTLQQLAQEIRDELYVHGGESSYELSNQIDNIFPYY